jgi:hypothetical protein
MEAPRVGEGFQAGAGDCRVQGGSFRKALLIMSRGHRLVDGEGLMPGRGGGDGKGTLLRGQQYLKLGQGWMRAMGKVAQSLDSPSSRFKTVASRSPKRSLMFLG